MKGTVIIMFTYSDLIDEMCSLWYDCWLSGRYFDVYSYMAYDDPITIYNY